MTSPNPSAPHPRSRFTGRARRATLSAAAAIALIPTAAVAQQAAPSTVQQPNVDKRRMSPDQVREVAPALGQYTQQRLYGELWKRPGLSPRDRSMVVVAAMIARGEARALTYDANQAIENGVKPAEISETITQLAFYAGWPNVFSALPVAKKMFEERAAKAAGNSAPR